jgi:hypothetical protein
MLAKYSVALLSFSDKRALAAKDLYHLEHSYLYKPFVDAKEEHGYVLNVYKIRFMVDQC